MIRPSTDTVAQLMRQVERRPSSSVAVEEGTRRLTIAQLRSCSNRLANAFIGMGLRSGDRVAYVAQNHLEYVILEFALLKSGLTKVPLNFRLTPSEIVRCLQLAEVRLVVADALTATTLDGVLTEEADVGQVSIGEVPGWRSVDQLISEGADGDPRVPVGAEDIYHIRFSSGSTGMPKGIAISQRAARSAILGNTWIMSTSSAATAPRTLQVAPLVYAGGWSVFPTLLRQGTNVVMQRFDADETLAVLSEQHIDWMFAVPTMLRRMAASSDLARLREAPLSCLMLAGEPAAIPAIEVMSEYTDALIQCWGQTEAPASTTLVDREDMQERRLWGSIGRPIPGVEFSVLRDGHVVEELDPGLEGELVIRTNTITSALLGAEDEHRERLLDDGWWRTSDLGRFDEEGRITIIGRASETIITGGTNIQPVEIERTLERREDVVEAVVVGVPDSQWGETPAALVHSPSLSGDATELLPWLKGELAGFKRPRHVFVSAEPIPRSSKEAKVARGQMKRLLSEWVAHPEAVPSHVTKVSQT